VTLIRGLRISMPVSLIDISFGNETLTTTD